MTSNPLVSIIIPVYNGSNYMREAIDSALAQTYKNIEVIVVNDGSNDNTEEIALSYGDKIRYFRKENGGVSSALNLGIKEMRGDYFSWLSHDDVYFPEKVEKEVEALCEFNDDRAIALCGNIQINKTGDVIQNSKNNQYLCVQVVNSWDVSLLALIKSGSFNGCALLIPKEAISESGGFDESLRFSQDFLMWAKILLRKFNLVYILKPYVKNRVHDGQLTQRGQTLFYSDTLYITKELYEDLKKASSKYNFVYIFSFYLAKYNCKDSLEFVLQNNKTDKVLSWSERLRIKMVAFYGSIRPFIRRIYYKFFKKVKTK